MKLKVLVCIKQVPDTNNVKIDQETGTLIRKGIKSILNPEDKCPRYRLKASLSQHVRNRWYYRREEHEAPF